MNNSIKKGVVVSVILLFVSVSVIPSSGTNIIEKLSTVSFNGNTLYVGGLGPGNYTTIQAAIDDASKGDTVYVFDDSSPYYENVVVDKSIELIGEDRETTLIVDNSDVEVIRVEANNITISGFTLRANEIGLFGSTNNSIIADNIFSRLGLAGGGLVLLTSSNNQIFYNVITGFLEVGIALFYASNNNVISNNTIQSTLVGIGLGICNFNRICNNTIQGCHEIGIDIIFSFFNLISKNNFMDNYCNAFFKTSLFNRWVRNYWEGPRFLPYSIRGNMTLGKINIPWVNFDWRPAQEPYNTEV